ncbi:hypothetical protein ACNHE5_00795 [Pandoraea pnomenusa]|uniref:hypothetical protein n=1 Tax=Pandoraea pnomenusa TaxID=93220 RepID=UPI003CE7E919
MAKQLFFVTALSNPEAVKGKLNEAIGNTDDIYELSKNQWLAYYDGLTMPLAEKIGIRGDPHVGSGLVVAVGSYSGRAPSTLWEWIKLRSE